MDILDKFIEQAERNIAAGYYNLEIPKKYKAKKVSLKEKIGKNNFCLIAEIKHASPAGEYCFEDIDAEKTAFLFKNAGADAISVVVEPAIFKGNLKNICKAKKTGLPILFKDFIMHETQIKAAASLGADCVLLIMTLADRLHLDINKMIESAHSFGLEVLLECYTREEMERALDTKADILGINNRDLRTLDVNLNRSIKIMENIGRGRLKGRKIISESGIQKRQDIELISKAGINAALVGTAIWKSMNQAEKIRELKGKY
ncbi:MAG: indole-3-glycerol-phosphate synthase [archaeon]